MDINDLPHCEDSLVFCPIFNRKIAEGLCFDISNIGNDSLCLSKDQTPSCGWQQAHEICNNCKHYN